MAKIVPSKRLRGELEELLAGVGGQDDPVEAVARLGARLILQQALEDEVTEFLGRERYERADGGDDAARATATAMSRALSRRRAGRSSSNARACATPPRWGSRVGCSAGASRARTRWRR
jgi:putative transposase